jgi:hypothetical protein
MKIAWTHSRLIVLVTLLSSGFTYTARGATDSPIHQGGFETVRTSIGYFSFEEDTAWQISSSHQRQIIAPSCGRVLPASGERLACLIARENGERNAIWQRIQLPSTRPLFLNHWLLGYSEERCDVPYFDRVAVYLGGKTLFENSRVCVGNPSSQRWEPVSFDISAFAGQTVVLKFEVSTYDTGASFFAIDNVTVSTTPIDRPLNW